MSFYTQLADSYESIFPFNDGIYGFVRRYLPAPPASVLDIGCGTGHYTGALAGDGYAAVGIDLDEGMIAHARAHYAAARFHVMDMLDIADLDRTFDGLACIGNTAAHLTQAQFARFVDAVAGVRAPGGPWILQVMNWDYVVTRSKVTFPVIEGAGNAVFTREYRDITTTQVTFATRLEVGGEVVFEDAVRLYPMLSAEIIDCHRARGFEVVEHLGSYAGALYDPAVFSANLFVFR